jgi:hypothetical protein
MGILKLLGVLGKGKVSLAQIMGLDWTRMFVQEKLPKKA